MKTLGFFFGNLYSFFFKLISFQYKTFDPENAKIYWLIKLRWLAIGLFLLSAVPNFYFGFLDRYTLPIYIGIISILFVLNVISSLVFANPKRKTLNLTLNLHLSCDVLLLTLLLYFSKGLNNPLFYLYFLNSALAGLLIGNNKGYPFLLLIHSVVLFLQIKYVNSMGPTLDIVTGSQFIFFHIMILSFWVVMSSLGRHIEEQNQLHIKKMISLEKQDRLRALGALSAGFSHEFSSPLNTAKLRIERMQKALPLTDENLSEALAAIDQCKLVIQQMNSSQLDSRNFQLKEIKMDEFLNDVVDSWHEENPQIQLEKNINCAVKTKISPLNFAQVIFNILDNAAQSPGVRKISVRFSEVKNSSVSFEVEDDGGGFSDEILARIGEPFVTNKVNGTGLGIYLAQILSQSLGGDLEISNLKTKGSVVKIVWPVNGVGNEKNINS